MTTGCWPSESYSPVTVVDAIPTARGAPGAPPQIPLPATPARRQPPPSREQQPGHTEYRAAEMTGEPVLPQRGSPVDPYQAANLARELEKALRALHYCRLLLRSKAQGNAALHLDDRVLHLPLTTIVEQAHASTTGARDWLRDQAGPDFSETWADIDSHPAASPRPDSSSDVRLSDSGQEDRRAP